MWCPLWLLFCCRPSQRHRSDAVFAATRSSCPYRKASLQPHACQVTFFNVANSLRQYYGTYWQGCPAGSRFRYGMPLYIHVPYPSKLVIKYISIYNIYCYLYGIDQPTLYLYGIDYIFILYCIVWSNNNNNNRRLVTLAEHTSDHGRQTNSSTEEKGE